MRQLRPPPTSTHRYVKQSFPEIQIDNQRLWILNDAIRDPTSTSDWRMAVVQDDTLIGRGIAIKTKFCLAAGYIPGAGIDRTWRVMFCVFRRPNNAGGSFTPPERLLAFQFEVNPYENIASENADVAFFDPLYVGPGKTWEVLHKSIHTLESDGAHEVDRSYYIPTRFPVQYAYAQQGQQPPVLQIIKNQIWAAVYLLENDGNVVADEVTFHCNSIWNASE